MTKTLTEFNQNSFQNDIDPVDAEINLHSALVQLGIDKNVDVKTVKHWITNSNAEDESFWIINLLFNLSFRELERDEMEQLISAILEMNNVTPQKALGNKSPQELSKEDPDKIGHLRLSSKPIGQGEWNDFYEKAFNYFHKGKYKKAMDFYNKAFRSLLEDKTTHKEIFRFFANKGVCHLALGQTIEGIWCVGTALELNPNYDFAQNILKKYKNGEYENDMHNAMYNSVADFFNESKNKKKEMKKWQKKLKSDGFGEAMRDTVAENVEKKFANDPANLYYNFLKDLRINFATDSLTKSKITYHSTDGKKIKLGRNDPCFCGSGKKFKKCCNF